MKIVTFENKIPNESIIKDGDFLITNYEDAISIEIPIQPHYTVDYIATEFFSTFLSG